MKRIQKILIIMSLTIVTLLVLGLILHFASPYLPYHFSRQPSENEMTLRLQVVSTAESWLGAQEGSENHKAIIDRYNTHKPLAQGYAVTYEDNWCATFGSMVAISCGLTDIIPTECGCERQIGLFQDLGRWEEKDTYLPQPGDYIYYAWDEYAVGDCTGWADHVGIVAGTWGPFIKGIEGNKDDSVSCRYITRWDPDIRGYGLPDYASKSA